MLSWYWDASLFIPIPTQSLALLILGAISPRRFVFFVIAQLLGAIAASAVLLGILPGPLLVLTQRLDTLGVAQALFWGKTTSLNALIRPLARKLKFLPPPFLEMFLTFALTMVGEWPLLTSENITWDSGAESLYFTCNIYSHYGRCWENQDDYPRSTRYRFRALRYTTCRNPVYRRSVRFETLTSSVVIQNWRPAAAVSITSNRVNTARAFGPAVVIGDFIGSHWIYVSSNIIVWQMHIGLSIMLTCQSNILSVYWSPLK